MRTIPQLPDFITIPKPIMEDRKLSQLDWMVYGIVYWYSRLKLERCTLSNQSLAKMVHADPRSIRRSLTRLENNFHIIAEYSSDGRSREIFTFVNYFRYVDSGTDKNVHKDRAVLPPGPDGPPNKNILIINNKEKKYIKKRKGLDDIGEEDYLEISDRYKVNPSFVKYQHECLRNYVESKGKPYKDYLAALRNFVLRGMREVAERPKKGGFVDATNL